MNVGLLCVWLLFLSAMSPQTEQPRAGCTGLKNHEFAYIGGQQTAPVSAQKYSLKRIRGRSIVGIPIPGGSGPRYQVKIANKPEPTAVAESRPVFHVSSETPVEEIVAIRLTRCGDGDCFNLYEDGPATMSLIQLESKALGPGCYEFHPQRPLDPGDYALVIFGPDLKPQHVARFTAGPQMPDIQLPK